MHNVEYGRAERTALWGLAVVGLFGVNGAFLYGVIHPEIVRAALGNPISLAFMAEALLLVIALAYLLTKWGVTRLPWTCVRAAFGPRQPRILVARRGASPR